MIIKLHTDWKLTGRQYTALPITVTKLIHIKLTEKQTDSKFSLKLEKLYNPLSNK